MIQSDFFFAHRMVANVLLSLFRTVNGNNSMLENHN